MTTATAEVIAGARRTAFDRVLAAYPLLVAYLVLLTLYAWQTTKHSTPWLFTDELQWAGLSRGVAHHAHPQLRLENQPFASLYAYFIAPSWWFGATSTAYAVAKYLNAAVMTATLFPAFALARLFVPRWAALACGIAAAAIPSVVYTGMLIPEPLAYFWSSLVLWLIARALLVRTRGSIALAVGVTLFAPLVRGQLGVLAATAVVAGAITVATGRRGRALVGSWSVGERIGAATLILLGLVWVGALLTHHSYVWRIGTYFEHRAFTYGLWAAGAFVIGVGVLPALASLAWLFGARFRAPDERVLGAMLISTVACFGLYTAVKASYISTNFAVRVEERNLIYIAPIVFAATARWLLAGRTRLVPLAVATAGIAYLLDTTPYHNTEKFYSDAPGLSILQWLNRKPFYFTTDDARRLLFGILIGLVVLALLRGRLQRVGTAVAAVLAGLVVGWNLTGEIAAANSSNEFSTSFRGVLPTPPDWIDHATGRSRTMFLGKSLADSNAFWSLEFWNQSIGDVWSVDGTAPGPGPTVTPDYRALTGRVSPQRPVNWVVATPGVEPVGRLIETVGGLRLFQIPRPVRIAAAEGGVSADANWMSTSSWYYHFAPQGPVPGVVTVTLSRTAACGNVPPSRMTIRVSRLRIDSQRQPVPGKLLAVRRLTLHSTPCDTRTIRIPVSTPFRVDVSAVGTFQPSQYDLRQLSAQIGFGFQ